MKLWRRARFSAPGARLSAGVRLAWITLGVVVAVFALGAATARVTASYRVCGLCHAMKPEVSAWMTSAHTRVACPACHETPRPWYAFPETLAERAGMLKRDWDAQRTASAASERGGSAGSSTTVPDSTCLRCHDLTRVVTMRYGTLIKHNEHAKRNKSCLSCHLYVGHPDPKEDRPLLLMERCFTCHGRTSAAKAPGTCETCHPKSFALRPSDHDGSWRQAHGKIAKAGRGHCMMCHEKTFCSDCHKVDMPHPARWRNESGHVVAARKDRHVCENCHGTGADLCDRCHHRDYRAGNGSWVQQHPPIVHQRGIAACMDCHVPTFCSYCHTSNAMKWAGSGAGR